MDSRRIDLGPMERYEIGREYDGRKLRHYNNMREKCVKTTAQVMAEECGISEISVKRFHRFFRLVNAMREISPDAAEKLMTGEATITDRATFDAIRDRQCLEAEVRRITGVVPEVRTGQEDARMSVIRQIRDDMRDCTKPEYTVDMLLGDIRADADAYIKILRGTLEEHAEMLTEEIRPQIVAKIIEIIGDMLKVREAL